MRWTPGPLRSDAIRTRRWRTGGGGMRNLPMPVRRVPTHGDVTGCLVAVCVHSACAIVLFLAAPSLGRHAALARVPAFALVVTAAMLLATAVVNERRFR